MKCGESDTRNETYQENFSEEKFYKLLLSNDEPLIIDIGAHKGESVEFFNSIFPKAVIYSVEPDPISYAALIEYLPDKSRVINAAIASIDGTKIFFQYDKSHLNSLHAINKESKDSLGYAEKTSAKEIYVRCITLNTLVRELGITSKRINLLKIDAQGGELDILSGANTALKKVDNITVELSLYDFYTKRNTFLEIEQMLPDFELYAITKLSQNPKNYRTDWAEVFYTRKTY